jgi:chromate reductase, NAD(P)H dehydrogenase (quinone)
VIVLAIPGSLRRGSFNRMLLEAAAECAPEGMNIAVAGLEGIPVFSEDLEAAREPEAVAVLRGRVERADGLLIATPEYNQSIPGGLKNAIDWLSRHEEVLARKPVCIVGATAGRWGTRLAQAALRHVLAATESLVMPAPALYLREAANLFVSGRLADEPARDALGAVLSAFAAWIP